MKNTSLTVFPLQSFEDMKAMQMGVSMLSS